MIVRAITVLAAASFLLHLLWERMHMVLYTNYDALQGMIPVSVYATLGDVLYTFLAVALITLFKDDWQWIRHALIRDYAGLSALGVWIALFVEYKALAFSRWAYTEAMPVIPFFEVGLSPVAQMAILLPLSVFLTGFLINRFSHTS